MNIKDVFLKCLKINSLMLLLLSLMALYSCNYSNANVESKWLTVIEKELGMPIDSLSSGLTRLKYLNSTIEEKMHNHNIKIVFTSEGEYLKDDILKLEVYGMGILDHTSSLKMVDYNEDVIQMIDLRNSDSCQMYQFKIIDNDTTGMDLKIRGVNI